MLYYIHIEQRADGDDRVSGIIPHDTGLRLVPKQIPKNLRSARDTASRFSLSKAEVKAVVPLALCAAHLLDLKEAGEPPPEIAATIPLHHTFLERVTVVLDRFHIPPRLTTHTSGSSANAPSDSIYRASAHRDLRTSLPDSAYASDKEAVAAATERVVAMGPYAQTPKRAIEVLEKQLVRKVNKCREETARAIDRRESPVFGSLLTVEAALVPVGGRVSWTAAEVFAEEGLGRKIWRSLRGLLKQ